MDNIVIAVFMMIIMIKSNDRSLPIIICAGSLMAFTIDFTVDDIAVFYALTALLASLLAYIAWQEFNNISAKCYSVMMIIQCLLCVSLVADWQFTANEALQYILSTYNATIQLTIITLGITGSDNIFTRAYGRCFFSSGSDNNLRNYCTKTKRD